MNLRAIFLGVSLASATLLAGATKSGEGKVTYYKDALPVLQKELPGSRILDGAFQVTGVAISIGKDRPAALAFLQRFIASAKQDGTIRRAFDNAGLGGLAIAP